MVKERVLFISPQPFFEWRGSSIRVKFTVMALTDLGYDVDLLTLPIGKDDPAVKANVIRVWNIFNAKSISIGPSLLKVWFDFLLLLKGSYLVLTRNYSVLHGTEEAGSICYILSKLCSAKTIYEKHSDSNSYRSTKNKIKSLILDAYLWVEKHTVRRSDLTIATGPSLAQQAKDIDESAEVMSIPDIPSSIIEPEVDDVARIRAQIADHDDQIIVTYVGSFASYQGMDIVFGSMAQVVRENPAIRFVIIGGNDDEIAHHKDELLMQGLRVGEPHEDVSFLGKIAPDELTSYLAASDILLVPRKSGINSPLKILDFFKAGVAIVATNTEANRRLLDDQNAELCAFDEDEFAEAILKLAGNPNKRKLLGENGYDAYKKRYNFDVFKTQLSAAYNSLQSLAVCFLVI